MTAAEMDALLVVEIDRANAPWFNPAERQLFLQSAYEEVVNRYADAFEVNEKARRALQKLVIDSAPVAGSYFDLTTLPDLKRIVSVRGVFSVTCGGKTEQVTRKIAPIQNDDKDQEDPFSKGDNFNPNYEEVSQKLVINSTSAPTGLTIRYVKVPVEINPVTFPLVEPEIGKEEHRSIVFTARDKMLENIESRRYPQSKAETAG